MNAGIMSPDTIGPAMNEVGTLVIGGGPGGLAPLLAAARAGYLDRLLEAGLVIVDRGSRIGGGALGSYIINSDSSAETFLSCVTTQSHPLLRAVADTEEGRQVAAYGKGAVPLKLAAALLDRAGEALHQIIEAHPRGRVLTGTEALDLRRRPDGSWSTGLRDQRGRRFEIASRSVILATGGRQPESRLLAERVGGVPLLPQPDERLVQSGAVLDGTALPGVARMLAETKAAGLRPVIAIAGGSTSAVSCGHVLLAEMDKAGVKDADLVLLTRQKLRLFYPSAEAALADGYDDFHPDEDACPVSGFVYRFGGMRFDNRELAMRLLGVGGRPQEPRLRLHLLQPGERQDPVAAQWLAKAQLVVAAFGYRPWALKVRDAGGRPITLQAQTGYRASLVDQHSAVLDEDGQPLSGLFGVGLAAGYVPNVAMGGEKSFRGQSNGLWLWQNDVGLEIAEGLLARLCSPDLPAQAA